MAKVSASLKSSNTDSAKESHVSPGTVTRMMDEIPPGMSRDDLERSGVPAKTNQEQSGVFTSLGMIKKEEYSPQDLEADFLQQLRKQEEADILVLGHNPSSNGSKQPTVNQKKRHMWKYAIAIVLVLIVVILAIVLLAVNALGGGDGDKTAVTTDPTTNGTGVLPPPDTTTRTPATSFTSKVIEHTTSTISTSTSTTSTIPIPRVGEWVQQGLDIDGITEYAAAGTSVSLSADGRILALGAYFNNGYAQVWEWNDR